MGKKGVYFSFDLNLTFIKRTEASMFYIACCAFVLMKHNVRINTPIDNNLINKVLVNIYCEINKLLIKKK